MCDYSLQNVKSRPARISDELVTTGFDTSTTRGFAALGDPGVAVCLRPGTELAFDRDVEYDNVPGAEPARLRAASKTARFRQLRPNEPYVHHDALEFPDGRTVLLTQLCEGQRATVLQLPASPDSAWTGEPAAERSGEQTPTSAVA
jgi:hypothetical protein